MTLSVNTEIDGCSHLVLNVVSKRAQLHLYTIKLLELSGIETILNDGRFEHFSRISQHYHVEIPFDEDYKERLPTVIDWISAHNQETWSFSLLMKGLGFASGVFDFSFANGLTAVAFALRWK